MVAQGGLTSVEQSLVANVCSGEPLDLISDVPEGKTIDEDTMRSWGPSQTCSATAIRDILRGQRAPDPDPHGLRLRGARITGRLDLESLATDVNLELKDCLLEEGVLARDADLATFSLAGCQLEHRAESPLDADRLTCSVLILSDARIIGHADAGAVRLVGAHIGGQLDCTGASLCNDSGPALLAYGLQVGQDMKLGSGFTATGAGDSVAIDLTDVQVAGTLVFDPARLEHAADPYRLLAVDGLTYTGVPETASDWDWLHLVMYGTPRYAAQPYQQLADGYLAVGERRQARSALMAQRDQQLARVATSWSERLWGRIFKVTLGYGYKPWRALVSLAGVVALVCCLTVVLGAHGALVQTAAMHHPGQPCSVGQQVGVGVAIAINAPKGASIAYSGCRLTKDPTSVTAAFLLTVISLLRTGTLVFVVLAFVLGLNSALRKT